MRNKIMSVVAAAAVAVSGMFFSGAANADEKIVIEGSSTVGPIAKQFAEFFMDKNKGVNITVNESGSGNGAKALISGKCDIATMSRFMKEKEFKAAAGSGKMPVAHAVAMDGIAVVVNPANPVGKLTLEQIHDIYAGKVNNWKQVGGVDMPIVIISRDTSSGTYETFETKVMHKDPIASGVETVGSNGQMRARVQSTKNAIGYVGLGFVDKSVKAVLVNNIPATKSSVASGVYPIARPLFMFTDGYPKPGSTVFRFITMYLSKDGEAIIERIGFVPLTAYKK